MADIFISYSSNDRAQALQLTELLSSAGLSVWIDKQGIDVATSWSGEISKAIEDCKALVLLLSPTSIESENVRKEVSLAAERKKKILPLDLEPVTLPHDFAYHLAGIQRTAMTNIDSIIRALGKIGLEATLAPTMKLVKETDSRKSLMILPFEDLSPTGDNGWFADGIATELISALSNVKSLRVADQQATKDYKRYQGTLPVYAKEMSIRYFIQGSVRKFGDQIKITSSLLDIETGDHLWQDSMKGTMDDIFDIQEKVAENVVGGLNILLTSDEKQKLAERGTESAEAYELYLKAGEYFRRQTKEGMQFAVQLNSEAIAIDPRYAAPYSNKALALAALYNGYSRDPKLLEEALLLIEEAKRIKSDFWDVNLALAAVFTAQGKNEEAEQTAKEFVRHAPQNYLSHFSLGFFYWNTGQPAKAIPSYEEGLALYPDDLQLLFNVTVACNEAKEIQKQKYWANAAIPKYEKHIKLFPEDESRRVEHAVLASFAERKEEAIAALNNLNDLRDGSSLYNAACLYCILKDFTSGIATFRKVLAAGFRNIQLLKSFLEDDDGIATLKGTPEYEGVKQLVEQIEAETKKHG